MSTQSTPPVTQVSRGFTLIEVMVAMAVFMLGFTGLLGLQFAAARHTRQANNISMASNLAADSLERQRVADFDTIPSSASETYDRYGDENGAPAFYTVDTTSTLDGTGTYRDVTVRVRWEYATGSEHSVEMQSRIVR